ncbi:hypothetical protein Hanom_Chr09g00780571 [Helianthus anomalus]
MLKDNANSFAVIEQYKCMQQITHLHNCNRGSLIDYMLLDNMYIYMLRKTTKTNEPTN